jgi:hypothetical protein
MSAASLSEPQVLARAKRRLVGGLQSASSGRETPVSLDERR